MFLSYVLCCFFFFKQKTAYEMRIRDWSSDVCSSDLIHMAAIKQRADKVDRHRQRMRAAGFRPVQFWVPDTRGADFAERVRQQCLKLKGDPAELDALRFVEEAAAQVEGWQ